MEITMSAKVVMLVLFVDVVWIGPAFAGSLSMCVTKVNSSPIPIKNAKTGDQLRPLQSGDLIYRMERDGAPTLAFRDGKLAEIVPGLKQLETKHLVDCDGPKSGQYPIIVPEGSPELQIIYDEFGVISDISEIKRVKLGVHSRCSSESDLVVAGWKRRELESKGVPLVRFCAAMSNDGSFSFDPETGRQLAYYQMSVKGELGATFSFRPIPCFLAARTRIDTKAQEVRPEGCVFRYNPLTGKPISEEEGRALAKLAVFSFEPGSRGGTVEDKEKLSQKSSRRLSPAMIEIIKNN
jgi:hypothetical protein